MRPIFLMPAMVIVPFGVIYFLKMLTGDPMIAVVLALIMFVTVAAWFAGISPSPGQIARRRWK
jgi:hypothetical protein